MIGLFHDTLTYAVLERYDSGIRLRVLADAFDIAKLAFEALRAAEPRTPLALQQGARVIARSPDLQAADDEQIIAVRQEMEARVPSLYWQEARGGRGWTAGDIERREIKATVYPTRRTWPGEQWEWSVAEHSKILITRYAATAEEARQQASEWYAGRPKAERPAPAQWTEPPAPCAGYDPASSD